MLRMKNLLLLIIIFYGSLSVNNGNAFLFWGGTERVVAARLAIIYFPFPKQSPHGWEALPTTNGLWTRERMLRDVKRLKNMNVSLTLLALTPDRLLPPSPYFAKDCQTFVQLCEAAGIIVYPMVTSTAVIPKLGQSVIVQFLQEVWNKKDAGEARPGRSLCFLAGEAVNWRVRDPAIQFVKAHALNTSEAITINDKTWLFSAVPGKSESTLPAKDREKSLEDGLKTLSKRSAPVSVLCLNAWNNYGSSEVVEPNTFDGNALYERLSQWAEKHIAKP